MSLYALPSQPLLCLSTHAGLSALRLPCCGPTVTTQILSIEQLRRQSLDDLLNHDNPDNQDLGSYLHAPISSPSSSTQTRKEPKKILSGQIDCPTCGKHLGVLADQVPMSHHVNSTIVCRISGEVMDSQNEPLAFHNGQVYSSKVRRISTFRTRSQEADSFRPFARWPKATLTSSLVRRRKRVAHSLDFARCTFHDWRYQGCAGQGDIDCIQCTLSPDHHSHHSGSTLYFPPFLFTHLLGLAG